MPKTTPTDKLEVTSPNSGDFSGGKNPVEVGWLLAGTFSTTELELIEQVIRDSQHELSKIFPEIEWVLHSKHQRNMQIHEPCDAITFVDHGVTQRDLSHWDFVVIVTAQLIEGYNQPEIIAAVSRSLDSIVISLWTLQDQSVSKHHEDDSSKMSRQRLLALFLKLFGQLNGLSSSTGSSEDFTRPLRDQQELSQYRSESYYSSKERKQLLRNFQQVADARVEEESETFSLFTFYLRSAWANLHEIVDALWKAKPWEFPIRLGRLSAAGLSSLLLLMMTAETWEVMTNQTITGSIGFALIVLITTTAFTLLRHRLLIRSEGHHYREQVVMANVTTVGVVAAGFVTTYALLFILTLCISSIFPTPTIHDWIGQKTNVSLFWRYFTMATSVSAFSLLIATMGASTENSQYLRHVTHIDDEV